MAALRAEQKRRVERGDRKLLGIGMACYVEMCGFGPFESAVVRVEPGGTVTAYTGTSAHGQGHETTFAQIIADRLGVDFDKIVVRHGDTMNTPDGQRHGRQPQPGRGRLGHPARGRRRAGARPGASPPSCWRRPPRTWSWRAGATRCAVRRVRRWLSPRSPPRPTAKAFPPNIESGLEATDFFRPPQLVYPFGAHVAVVEVDRETRAR